MKSSKSLLTFTVLAVALVASGIALMEGRAVSDDLMLDLELSKNDFLLGEPIEFRVALRNMTTKDIVIANTIDPVYGSLKIWSRSEKQSKFDQYVNPKWGILEPNGSVRIKPGESTSNNFRLIARLDAENLPRFYFAHPGIYELKVSYEIHVQHEERTRSVESRAVIIRINEPVGEDLVVWNRIKEMGELAYFLQNADFHMPIYRKEERDALRVRIEEILDQYPSSALSEAFRRSLVIFRKSAKGRN